LGGGELPTPEKDMPGKGALCQSARDRKRLSRGRRLSNTRTAFATGENENFRVWEERRPGTEAVKLINSCWPLGCGKRAEREKKSEFEGQGGGSLRGVGQATQRKGKTTPLSRRSRPN